MIKQGVAMMLTLSGGIERRAMRRSKGWRIAAMITE